VPIDNIKNAAKAAYWSLRDAQSDIQKARAILTRYITADKDVELLIAALNKIELKLEPARQYCRGLAGEEDADLEYWSEQIDK
jgi:hypothetical protein